MHLRGLIGSILFLSVAVMPGTGYGQVFGGNPPSVRWKQINTDTVRVIFPAGDEQRGQRVTTTVHQLQRKYAHTIGDNIRKINIVLQNETLLSNGYVGLGPYRSEFYTTPTADAFSLGAVNWTDVLSVHEFRHVQQYSNFRKGISQFVSVLTGEEGLAVANSMAIPNWFFEGDAVFNETKLTRQGRGTLPLFFSDYQSLYNAGRQYSYMKMRNGSLRQYVPDHYALGYLLVAYGRKQYGEDLWRKVTDDAARFRPPFYPFQGAVKKHTGIAFPQFVQEAMHYYQQQWQEAKTAEPSWITATAKNKVMDYKYPYAASGGSVIVLKSSYDRVPAFYRIYPDKTEERIATREISGTDYFGYNNERIVYTADRPDMRWGNRDYNTIHLLDTRSGTVQKVTGRGRYFSPDISHNGEWIAVVNQGRDTSELLVLRAKDGKVVRSVQQSGLVYSYPKFSANDAAVFYAVRNDRGDMAIQKMYIAGGKTETLLPFTNRIIGFLQVAGDTVLLTTTHRGKDELWAFVDAAGDRGPYRLAAYSTGIYQGTLTPAGKLVAAAFTANGYRLAGFQPLWEKLPLKDELTPLYVADAFRQSDHFVLDSIDHDPAYPVSRYRKGFHLLNIHSWRPYYDYPEYSFTLYGQNVLNTLRSEIAYTYNSNEGSHRLGYNGIYGGTYLQPVFGVDQTWQRSALWNRDTMVNWNELSAHAGLRLPLNLTGGRQYRSLVLQTTLNTEQVIWTGVGQKLLRNGHFNFLEARLQYGGQVQQALQQINPRWGQSLLVQYRSTINEYTARQWLISGSVYLPGFLRNHSLVLSGAIQGRDTLQQYFFRNNFPFSRGYRAVDFPRLWKLGANYHFPVGYPDWGFGQLVYFLRVRANAFYDYTVGRSLRTGKETKFNTVGGELYFDTRWWNEQPVTIGIRYSRLLDKEFYGVTQPGQWELILPVRL